ncbi:hypothetical protein BLNAU_24106 [Blattamonas nauphoetae]|uniref:Uncharacterized protein n=1 Tax=Blattamonas nauphoetae TaxID=2049346 RepID=A0ABQ9WRA1_9EUKA|nr:hypothetical protein BLNAU_24106 [Blattamonas nauphoetae]
MQCQFIDLVRQKENAENSLNSSPVTVIKSNDFSKDLARVDGMHQSQRLQLREEALLRKWDNACHLPPYIVLRIYMLTGVSGECRFQINPFGNTYPDAERYHQ